MFIAFFVAPLLAAGPAVWPLLAVLIVAMSVTRPGRRFPTHRFDVTDRRPGDPPRPWGAPPAAPAQRRPAAPSPAAALPPLPAARSPFDTPPFWELPAVPADRRAPGPELTGKPPAWDPLGVAPFAWDLPEPPPLRLPRTRRRRVVAVRVGVAAVMMAGALATIGELAGWLPLTGLTVVGTTVAALVIGTLIGSAHSRAVRRAR